MIAKRNKRWIGIGAVLAVIAATILWWVQNGRWDGVGSVRRLPDGSRLELYSFLLATNLQENYRTGARWQFRVDQALAAFPWAKNVLPPFILKRLLPTPSGLTVRVDGNRIGHPYPQLFVSMVDHGAMISRVANQRSGCFRCARKPLGCL